MSEWTPERLDALAADTVPIAARLTVGVRDRDKAGVEQAIGGMDVMELRTTCVVLAALVLAALAERTPLSPAQARVREKRALDRAAERVRLRVADHARDDADRAALLAALGLDQTGQEAVA